MSLRNNALTRKRKAIRRPSLSVVRIIVLAGVAVLGFVVVLGHFFYDEAYPLAASAGERLFLFQSSILTDKNHDNKGSKHISFNDGSSISVQSQQQQPHQPQQQNDIYHPIMVKALETIPNWPDCDDFVRMMQTDARGHYIPPRFDDGYGPVGVSFQFFRNNHDSDSAFNHHDEATSLLVHCRQAMTDFCQQAAPFFDETDANNINLITTKTKTKTTQSSSSWYYLPRLSTLHMIVAVFQAHPSFLTNAHDRETWQAITADEMHLLIRNLHETLDHRQEPITLRLSSLLWTPDGALIAGFVEEYTHDNNHHLHEHNNNYNQEKPGPFAQLRLTCIAAAQDALPQLSSRPKNLMHVTLGRLLKRPSSSANRKSLGDLMQRYNTQVLPAMVRSIHQGSGGGGRIVLRKMVLIREKVWLSNHYEQLAVFPFQQQHLQGKEDDDEVKEDVKTSP